MYEVIISKALFEKLEPFKIISARHLYGSTYSLCKYLTTSKWRADIILNGSNLK